MLLRVAEVMELLGCGRSKVYELMSCGDLRSVKFGGCRRIPSDELERFIADLDHAEAAEQGTSSRPTASQVRAPSTG